MSDLLSLWPRLTPRERDAKVAEALEFELWEWVGPLASPTGRALCVRRPGRAARVGSAWRPIPWISFLASDLGGRSLARYSTSWEHAGGLLDRLREEWADIELAHVAGRWRLRAWDSNGRSVATHGCATAAEAIAIAFCLSREVAS